MTWVRIDHAAVLHPKLLEVGGNGVALWLAGLCHANRHATDGVVLKKALPSLYPSEKMPRWLATKTAKTLVEAGLWAEANDAFLIVNYERYQAEAFADRQQERRAAAAERQRRKREREREAERQRNDSERTAKRQRNDDERDRDLNDFEDLSQESRCDTSRPYPNRSDLDLDLPPLDTYLPPPDLPTVDQGRPPGPLDESGVFKLEPSSAKPKKPRAPRKRDPEREAERRRFSALLDELVPAAGVQRSPVPTKQTDQAIDLAKQRAAQASLTLDAAMAERIQGACILAKRGKPLRFAVVDYDPNVAIAAPLRGLKPTRAPATTSADFPADAWREQLAAIQATQRRPEAAPGG